MKTEIDFIFLGSKVAADGDCSHEIKQAHAPWKKSQDKLRQHMKKQRDYFANKGMASQSYVFFFPPVVMYGHESWIIKKAES